MRHQSTSLLNHCFVLAAVCAGTLVLMVAGMPAVAHDRNTLVPRGHDAYTPSPIPDRVMLMLTAEPHNSQSVNWRTTAEVEQSIAQITRADGRPGLHLKAQSIEGQYQSVKTENGQAHYHSVTFTELEPDTLYAYRVIGDETWSEWFQFKTAPSENAPFSFFYFGDAQNSVRSHFSRVIREAFMQNARPAFMLHAGDMVNLREGNHDDEWGEWFDAGSFLNAMVPSAIVAGNHEFVDRPFRLQRALSPQFQPQFTTPQNGPEGLQDTVYHLTYQDTLIVVMDSMNALYDDDHAQAQAQWLDELLETSQHRWVIVSHHHPIHSVSVGRDNPPLREFWQPIYERHGVDLVLQGHDHTYGRGLSAPVPDSNRAQQSGPMYVVSVAGPKMYMIADEDNPNMQRMGEELQLYQTIEVSNDRIHFQAWTAAGELYDAFAIHQDEQGNNTIENLIPMDRPIHRCTNPDMPESDRCWNGKELISSPDN